MRREQLRCAARKWALCALLCFAGNVGAGTEVPLVEVRHLFDLDTAGGVALSMPSDVKIGQNGRAYVVDGGNHRVVAFSPSGQYLFVVGRKGEGNGEFRDPVGIGVDRQGRIYVADSGNHRIQKFDADGHFLGAFTTGTVRPIDVAPDAEGKVLYVSGEHKLTAYSSTGNVLRQWGGEGQSQGQFRYPASVLVTQSGQVYVVDVLNSRVQIFNPQGNFVFQVGEWGVLPGQLFRPKGVALDSQRRIYVTDSYMDLVEVFNKDYQFRHVLRAKGKNHNLTAPAGMDIDASDRLFVAEMLANKVSVFSLR